MLKYYKAELNNGTTDVWTISNGEYKLSVNAYSEERMYDLANDAHESFDLLTGAFILKEEKVKLCNSIFSPQAKLIGVLLSLRSISMTAAIQWPSNYTIYKFPNSLSP